MPSCNIVRMDIVKIFNHKTIHILLIIIVALLAYSDTFTVPFHFDDLQNIVENPLIKNTDYLFNKTLYCSNALSVENKHLCKFFSTRYTGYLTFALNYRIHGLDVVGYHIFNLLIHITNATLVYFLLIFTFETPVMKEDRLKRNEKNIALLAALFFTAHPVQTQAVTYIFQRVTSLSVLFYLASVAFYIIWRINNEDGKNIEAVEKEIKYYSLYKNIVYYLLSVLFSVLAMKTKEIAFTLPVTIFIYETLFFKCSTGKRVLYIIPFIFTSLIIPLSLLYGNIQSGDLLNDLGNETRLQTNISRLEYLITEIRVIITYLRLIVFPANQNLDYDYPIAHSFFTIEILLSSLVLIGIISLAVFMLLQYRDKFIYVRLISFGIFWFFITLSVESSIIPIIDVIFEHRLYLPSTGIFMAISTGVFLFVDINKTKWRQLQKSVILLMTFLILILAATTYLRNMVWRSDIALWSDVIIKSPNKLRGYYNLAKAYQNANNQDNALKMYAKVISIDNKYLDAYYNSANIYYSQKKYDNALEFYNKIIKLDNKDYQTHNNMGNVYLDIGEYDKAIISYNIALSINPSSDKIYNNRGRLFFKMKEYEKAIIDFTTALYFNPKNASCLMNRGQAFYMKGLIQDAMKDMLSACNLGNGNACSYYNTYLNKYIN